MHSHHLFGPVTASFAEQNLASLERGGKCVSFGSDGTDLPLTSINSWEALVNCLPEEWQPGFIALWLPYTKIPEFLWSAPVPIIGLAADWNLLWHQYRSVLPCCDVILTDKPGVEVLHLAGFTQARPANLFGLERDFFDEPGENEDRDIDVLFVGNLHPPVQRERLRWLARLASLSERFNVRIATGVFGADYRKLLRRSKIAFNRSIRGECNKRSFEAPACGALLFQEAENREIRQWLDEGSEFVAYNDENLETLLEEYLTHNKERQVIASAAQNRVQNFGFATLWSETIQLMSQDWPEVLERARERIEGKRSLLPAAEPSPLLADLARVELLARSGTKPQAIDLARTTLATAQRPLTQSWSPVEPWPDGFDFARVEWEQAAWLNAGDPVAEAEAKQEILRWRLHLLLADLNNDLVHYYEAMLARPDLPVSRAALGCALARNGRLLEARTHLERAVAEQPFDLPAVRALAQVLLELGDRKARQQLEHDRRQLAKAAPGIVPEEDWFALPPAADALASLIILCCNEVEGTRGCLESVCKHTRQPYELILIDNGSTDATPALLEEVRSWSGPARVEIIRNAENRGYPIGVNQGLAVAKGEFLVLLNNDTIVTPSWLDGLVRVSLVVGGAGLVGPVSNGAPPPQLVPFSFTETAELDAFALERQRQFAGQAAEFPRLTGFCLLIRRDALRKIGALDERYGTGFFEDDDLCLRARKAGLRLRIAPDVFIHHEGGRTFRSLGLDTSALLDQNFELFRQKWGDEHAAPYQRPGKSPAVESPRVEPTFSMLSLPWKSVGPPRKSLTMIVKNEEENLPDCLSGVRDLVDEMIIVDTGSTDRTKQIALQFGAKVFDFPWVDSFAAARNESLRHATGDWVFWLDADDRVNDENRAKLRELFATLPEENAAFGMKCRCVEPFSGGIETVVDHVRLFRNDRRLSWRYRVHEQILPALRQIGAKMNFSKVEIQHVGYIDPALRARKLQRDLRLLNMEHTENPDDPFVLFNLGSVYQELGQQAEAIPLLRKSLDRSHPDDSIVRKLYTLIAQCHRKLGQAGEALSVCQAGRRTYPDDAELLLVEAVARDESGDPAGAETCYRTLIEGRENEDHFASVADGLRGHLGRHNLAVLLLKQKRYTEAEVQWRMALTAEPNYLPAKFGLGELYLERRNFTAMEQTVEQFADRPEAAVLRGRARLARQEFAVARWELTQAIDHFPKHLGLRVILSHALLQEGKDPIAAEQALRTILEFDPNHAEAKNNLEVLLRERNGKK